MEAKLTTEQSFNVMYEFLDIYFLQNRSGDLATILGGMSFLQDGGTADPAMWGMWIESIDNICKKQNLKNDGMLTNFQAFVAMMEFLDLYFGPQSYGDVEDFIRDIKFVITHPSVPTITWGNWLKAIKVTLSFEVYKNNLILFKD
ncbi:hypothetical protein KBC04_05725 [Candidatus Babeliales bacterium]|nr:hypothetical protein [Candidatus Babeliales bacterium]MBP9844406.1 hypothetical protein [Candidatus Babeliales bacterium]